MRIHKNEINQFHVDFLKKPKDAPDQKYSEHVTLKGLKVKQKIIDNYKDYPNYLTSNKRN